MTHKNISKNKAIIVVANGNFHGRTVTAVSMSDDSYARENFGPFLSGIELVPFNDIKALETLFRAKGDRIASYLVEPIQGEGGVCIPDDDFLPALRQRCTEVGALLIFDEVITGFGRTGKLFASEHWNVVPDILLVAKALGGGMPLGAFISTPQIMATLSHDPALAHVTTFGGHPVCCAAGLASLDVIFQENLVQQAREKGEEFVRKLKTLRGEGGCTDVRGRGLLIGMDFATPHITQRFVQECFAHGLVLGWTLHEDTVVRLAPPLVISSEEIDRAVSIMQQILARL